MIEASSARTAIALAILPNVAAPAIFATASPQQYQVSGGSYNLSRDYPGVHAGDTRVICVYRPQVRVECSTQMGFLLHRGGGFLGGRFLGFGRGKVILHNNFF